MKRDDSNHRSEVKTSRGGGYFEDECASCGHVGLEQRQVPTPGEPKTKRVCPACGHVHDVEARRSDKR